MTCAELEALSAELALGTVSGPERASALSHLAACPSCRHSVDQLAQAADRILLLAPVTEPPPGFESRVLGRLATVARAEAPSGRRRWFGGPRPVLARAAAMVLVAGLSGAGAAAVLNDRGAGHSTGAVRTALARDDGGHWSCRVVVYGESPTWLVVSLDRTDGLSASFSVEAVRAGGDEAVSAGTLSIQDGHGSLATVVGLPPDGVDAIRVRDAGGRVRYTVDLPSA